MEGCTIHFYNKHMLTVVARAVRPKVRGIKGSRVVGRVTRRAERGHRDRGHEALLAGRGLGKGYPQIRRHLWPHAGGGPSHRAGSYSYRLTHGP